MPLADRSEAASISTHRRIAIHPIVNHSRTVHAKGVTFSKEAKQTVEDRLQRNPNLPKWDILTYPA